MSFYEYVASRPCDKRDPIGLELSPSEEQELKDKFYSWYGGEKKAGLGWLTNLPDCPCFVTRMSRDLSLPGQLGMVFRIRGFWKWWANPDPNVWDVSELDSLLGYHPGASVCIRSKGGNAAGAAQQCCYDECGQLITHGLGAGTPDRSSTDLNNFGKGGHQEVDVEPYDWADDLDEESPPYEGDPLVGNPSEIDYRAQYREVRPPNNGNKCAKNP